MTVNGFIFVLNEKILGSVPKLKPHNESVRGWVTEQRKSNLRFRIVLIGCLSILKTVSVSLILSTVNLLDSRSVMGDLGWVAYPKNGVSIYKMLLDVSCCYSFVDISTKFGEYLTFIFKAVAMKPEVVSEDSIIVL